MTTSNLQNELEALGAAFARGDISMTAWREAIDEAKREYRTARQEAEMGAMGEGGGNGPESRPNT